MSTYVLNKTLMKNMSKMSELEILSFHVDKNAMVIDSLVTVLINNKLVTEKQIRDAIKANTKKKIALFKKKTKEIDKLVEEMTKKNKSKRGNYIG